jgi:hypothetical protein
VNYSRKITPHGRAKYSHHRFTLKELKTTIMKKVIGISAILGLLTLAIAAPASAATKVFVLAGQSNMCGEGGYTDYMADGMNPWTLPPYHDADAPCPAPYNQPLDAVKFWNFIPDTLTNFSHNPGVGNGWLPLQNGYGNRTDGFGPELSFGAKIHEMYPNDEICIVKFAIGGTNLGYQWNPTYKNNADSLYKRLTERVNAAMNNLIASGKNPTVAGMCWMQGENDSTVPAYAAAYSDNLTNLVLSARADFLNASNMRFVVGRITNMTVPPGWASQYNCNLVRDAQQTIAARVPNSAAFNTDDLQWAIYGHYGTQGQIDLGLRYAARFPAPVPEPSTWMLIGTGFLGLVGLAWKNRK